MVYKKYIKRGGKVYGPYIYRSKRIGSRVITSYVGKHISLPEDSHSLRAIKKDPISFLKRHYIPLQGRNSLSFLKKHYIPAILSGFFLLLTIFVFLQFTLQPTSRAFLEISESFPQDRVEGFLKLNLKEGEFLPQDTFVKVSLGPQEKEYLLSELISDVPAIEGSF